ncbi:MAG TPA: response regulator [Terriglobales bacterium]|nr:response regulator [Terriglobales bacterium]
MSEKLLRYRSMSLTALVVDDSMLIRHSICRFLQSRGVRVESATNGSEALEMVGWVRPDLIFTDLQMPKMDGPALIAALQARPETAAIPIVVLAGRQPLAQELESKIRNVIFKDIDIVDQLSRVLESILPRPTTV